MDSSSIARHGLVHAINGFTRADAWSLWEQAWPEFAAWLDERPWTYSILPSEWGATWAEVSVNTLRDDADNPVFWADDNDPEADIQQFAADYGQVMVNLAVTYQWCSVFRQLLVAWCETYGAAIPEPRLSEEQRQQLADATGFDVGDTQVSDETLAVSYTGEQLAVFMPDPAQDLVKRIAALEQAVTKL